MQTYVRIVQAGSLSAASKQLRVSVAAVSRHLSALEAELGTPLVARTTRAMTMTLSGQHYYERCQAVLREVEKAQAVGREGVRGPLRISVPIAGGRAIGALMRGGLLDTHPALRLEVRLEDRLVDLSLDHADIALRVRAKPPDSSDLIAVPLARWRMILVAAPRYLRRAGSPTAPQQLGAHETVVVGAATSWTLVRDGEKVRVDVTPRIASTSGDIVRDAALDGRGISLLPDFSVQRDLRAKRFRRVLPAWASEEVTMCAIYRASLRKDERVRTVIDYLRLAFKNGTWPSA